MNRLWRILPIVGLVLAFAQCRVDFDAVEDSVREARRGVSNYEWRDDSGSLKVTIKGQVTLSADESRIESVEPEGMVKVEQRGQSNWTYDAVPLADGSLRESFTHDGKPVEPGDESRRWMQEVLPRIMRETGIDAGARVRRLLTAGGWEKLSGEIAQISSSSVKRLYIEEFLLVQEPNLEQTRQLARLAAGLEASQEAERIVEQLLDRHPRDAELTGLLVEAAGAIRSSSGRVRMTEFIVHNRDIDERAAIRLAESLTEIRSSADKSRGLEALAETAPDTAAVQLALLDAAGTISSSSDAARAFRGIIENSHLDRQVAIRAAEVLGSIRSESERSGALRQLAAEMPLDGEVLQAVLDAAGSLSTSSREQVVMVLLRRDYDRAGWETLQQFVREGFPEGTISTRLQQRVADRIGR